MSDMNQPLIGQTVTGKLYAAPYIPERMAHKLTFTGAVEGEYDGSSALNIEIPKNMEESDPTVPAWAKAETKPSYTAQEVGALPANTVIPSIDPTLTQSGAAADAKAVGDALAQAKESGEFNGKDGKSAYQYAQDGGYTGTEEEFAEKLASPTPDWVAQKEQTGGDNVYIPEQKVSSGIWNNLQISLQPDLTYDVTFNGEVYACVARASGSYGGVVLGNNTELTLNDYPFCINWAGGTATSGMFFKRSDISWPVTFSVKDHVEIVYDKMPEGYLPDCVVKSVNGTAPDENGNVEVEAGGIDVTATVGQTIVVTEVDANGKPTKWEAADYQEKICGTVEKVFLETTEAAFNQDPETGVYVASVACGNTPEENVVYRVTFNGVTYENTYNATMNSMGNLGLLGMGEDTGEPYVMAFPGGAINIISLVETASATVGIVYDGTQKIADVYLPDAPFFDITELGSIKASYYSVCPDGFLDFAISAYKRGGGKLRAIVPVTTNTVPVGIEDIDAWFDIHVQGRGDDGFNLSRFDLFGVVLSPNAITLPHTFVHIQVENGTMSVACNEVKKDGAYG